MSRFLQALHSGRLLLMDGAMGTQLQRFGLRPGECYEAWNLTRPEIVRGIHQAYVAAGAECLLTNTFQANPQALARFGLHDQLEDICTTALALARSAVGPDRFVLASIGPLDMSQGTADLQRVLLALAGADAYLLETWTSDFVQAVRCATDPAHNPHRLPVLLSLTYAGAEGDGEPFMPTTGQTAGMAAEQAATLELAALGVNCGRDMDLGKLRAVLRSYRACSAGPLFVRPNAGSPVRLNEEWTYPLTPEQLAAWLVDLRTVGLAMIGGCCGTTPEHIRALSAQL
jgi:5-methyltetrahydrofolate--homocysteine methyltransferase